MIKRMLCLCLCFCMLLSVFSVSAQAEERTYLALGDSISTGYGLANVKEEGFADLLAAELNYKLINRAINGNTTGGLALQLVDKNVQKYIADAQLVTITIGGNDMMALFYGAVLEAFSTLSGGAMTLSAGDVVSIMSNPSDARMKMLMMCAQMVLLGNPAANMPAFIETEAFKAGLDAYAAALKGIVATIHTFNPNVPVVVATQYNPFAGFTAGAFAALNTGFEAGVQMLNQTIRENAEAGGYHVAEVYGAFAGSPEYLYNAVMEPLNLDIHPNAAGHKVIEKAFKEAFLSLE